jgi:transcription initiation factor IIE alpha subunit
MGLSYDQNKKGLETIFEPWQISCLDIVFSQQVDYYIGTREVYDELVKKGVEISRASVINFLRDMTDEGLVKMREVTGKGGHRSQYAWRFQKLDLPEVIGRRLILSIRTELGVKDELA